MGNHIDASIVEMENAMEHAFDVEDASLKLYIDQKVAAEETRATNAESALNQKIDNVSTSLSNKIVIVAEDLADEVRERKQDLSTAIHAEDVSLKRYTDILRDDTNAAISNNAAIQKAYTDASIDDFRTENSEQHTTLKDALEDYTDASIARLRSEVNEKFIETDISVNVRINRTFSDAKSYTDNLVNDAKQNLRDYSDDNDASLKTLL